MQDDDKRLSGERIEHIARNLPREVGQITADVSWVIAFARAIESEVCASSVEAANEVEGAEMLSRDTKAIVGALHDCIKAHGPITSDWVGSAAKRIKGSLKIATSPAQEQEQEQEQEDEA